MDFSIPTDIQQLLDDLDQFIDDVISPIENEDDNIRFFDHRREDSRTDWERDGLPNAEWEALLRRMREEADTAGFLRWHLPTRFGGQDGSNLGMAIIREHLARKGLGLHNDLQNESSIIGNFPTVLMMEKYGSPAQQEEWIPKMLAGEDRLRPHRAASRERRHVDGDHCRTRRRRVGHQRREVLEHRPPPRHPRLHLRPHLGEPRRRAWHHLFHRSRGRMINRILGRPGFQVEEFMWTFNMPTDHAHVRLTDVRVHNDDILGDEGRGLQTAQLFVHENRIRQAASSVGAGLHCIDVAVEHVNNRTTFGKPLSQNQAIQFPLAELYTEAEMIRALIWKTAWEMDEGVDYMEITDRVAMCNYRGNRFCCDAADRAMQSCGGYGYGRKYPFEHIYRHHRRYRITEGSEEIQIRKVAGKLFGYAGRAKSG